jgi:hypothetical protein
MKTVLCSSTRISAFFAFTVMVSMLFVFIVMMVVLFAFIVMIVMVGMTKNLKMHNERVSTSNAKRRHSQEMVCQLEYLSGGSNDIETSTSV